MFVDFFIRRPVFATVCSLFIVIAGAVCIPLLPIAQYPQLAPPQVTVTSVYTGANAQTVESAVTTPLEQAINGVEGMRYITSASTNDGVSQITVTFDLSRNLDVAAVDVQNRISTVTGRLPTEVNTSGITITKNSSAFVMAAGFYSDDNRYNNNFISNYIDVYVKDALKRIPGVGDVMIFGERKYSMRIWLDPVRLAARGLTASDVVNALREQNVEIAAGQVGAEPAPANQLYQISVRAVGRLSEASQFNNIILKTGSDGSLIRLRDVGRAELGAEAYNSNLAYNGYQSIGIGVMQLPTANAIDVDRAAREELARLSKFFPPGLKYAIAFDTTTVVGESIREVLYTLLLAIALVVLVMFFFLQDWRSTLIPAVTIPVSLVGTFAFIKLLGFSINTLTLFGITLATGLVVDDAIVVIENVKRHMGEEHINSHVAASEAMGEVTGAVIATSLVLVSVFVPVAFFPGTTGLLYKQFSLTIAFSIVISAFNSLTFTPALSALILRGETGKGRFFSSVETAIHGVTVTYRNTARRALRFRWVLLVLFFVGLGLTYWVFQKVPTGFVPDEDQGYFMVTVQSPEGASLGYTTKIMDQVQEVLARNQNIQGVFSVAGFSFAGASPNSGIAFVNLAPISERKQKEQSSEAIIGSLRGPLGAISGAMVVPFAPPPIEGLSNFGGFQFEIQDEGGTTPNALYDATQRMVREGNARKDLSGLFSSFTANDPQFVVNIDREKAKSLDVPLSQISDALQVYMGSEYVNDFDFNNRSYRVYVQADKQFRSQPRDIHQYYVRSDKGMMMPLESLVSVRETTAPQIISHYNLFRSAEIDGSPAPGYSSGEAINAMEDLAKKVLPLGMGYSWTGLSLEEIKSGGQSIRLFGLGLLFVYLTLAAQYESFTLPFIILLGVPMALLGALGAQAMRGLLNDVYCQIGLVMLIGLASKNGILIVEFAEQLRRRGLSISEAAVEAARIRLRPILMTSFAFILGVLPLVFASGAGQASRHSVGTTVVGGMIVSTILNLLFIPVLYVIVKSLTTRKAKGIGAIREISEPEIAAHTAD
ncbi:MAG TPA: multidrug efflux RND transporter permease subunit [Terriglobales bacterium]|nr:multidrug efflux RND transporter permease subunit [Terriglobales bacterium]